MKIKKIYFNNEEILFFHQLTSSYFAEAKKRGSAARLMNFERLEKKFRPFARFVDFFHPQLVLFTSFVENEIAARTPATSPEMEKELAILTKIHKRITYVPPPDPRDFEKPVGCEHD